MAAETELRAQGPNETRAVMALQAARSVAAEIETMRERNRRDRDLVDAVERLCNLISLAVIEINEAADADLRARFGEALDEVQRRLFQVHFNQLSAKLTEIHQDARAALSEQDYRLGLAARLESEYHTVINGLIAMGGVQVLGVQLKSLEATAADLRELAEIELRVFRLVDFDDLE